MEQEKNYGTSWTSKKEVEQIISFGANQIFQDKTTYTCLLILKKTEQEHLNYLEVQSLKDWKTRNIASHNYDSVEFAKLDDDGWILVPGNLKPIFESIAGQSETLELLIGSENIYNGIQTSANNIYIHTANKLRTNNFIIFKRTVLIGK